MWAELLGSEVGPLAPLRNISTRRTPRARIAATSSARSSGDMVLGARGPGGSGSSRSRRSEAMGWPPAVGDAGHGRADAGQVLRRVQAEDAGPLHGLDAVGVQRVADPVHGL